MFLLDALLFKYHSFYLTPCLKSLREERAKEKQILCCDSVIGHWSRQFHPEMHHMHHPGTSTVQYCQVPRLFPPLKNLLRSYCCPLTQIPLTSLPPISLCLCLGCFLLLSKIPSFILPDAYAPKVFSVRLSYTVVLFAIFRSRKLVGGMASTIATQTAGVVKAEECRATS